MAKLPVTAKHGAAGKLGARDASGTFSETLRDLKKDGNTDRRFNCSTTVGGTSVSSLSPQTDILETLTCEVKGRQKSSNQKRRSAHRGVVPSSESSATLPVCSSFGDDNHQREGSSRPSSEEGRCSGSRRMIDTHRTIDCRRDSQPVGATSGPKYTPLETKGHVLHESSAESSSGDSSSDSEGDDEIDLRAKTEQELSKQREDFEDTDESCEEDEYAVEASFGLFDPRESDEEAIYCLLRQSILRSDLKFSPSGLQQIAATVAQQGNIGSVLKTIENEASEDEETQQRLTNCSSSSAGGGNAEHSSYSSKGSHSPRVTRTSSSGGRQTRESVGEDASGTKERGEDGEAGTVVGFLTLLSIEQYPEVAAPFEEAILKLASEHASVEQRRTLEQMFVSSTHGRENPMMNRNRSSVTGSKTGTRQERPYAHLSGFGEEKVNCGWLLKERLTNTPSQLIPQMYESLLEDISWSLSTEEMDETERPFYVYTHVCGLTRAYKAGDEHSHPGSFKRHKSRETLPFDAVFLHPEDEVLVDSSSLAFAWPTGQSVRMACGSVTFAIHGAHQGGERERAGQLRKHWLWV